MLKKLLAMLTPAFCSREARESVDEARLLQIVYGHIASCGKDGCTDEEGQLVTNIPGNSWRPARLILEKRLLVGTTGDRRKNISGRSATVWVIRKYAIAMRYEVSNNG